MPNIRKLTEREVAILTSARPTRVIGALLGMTTDMVSYRRVKLGIRSPTKLWSDDEKALLIKHTSDCEVMRKTGRAASSVKNGRKVYAPETYEASKTPEQSRVKFFETVSLLRARMQSEIPNLYLTPELNLLKSKRKIPDVADLTGRHPYNLEKKRRQMELRRFLFAR